MKLYESKIGTHKESLKFILEDYFVNKWGLCPAFELFHPQDVILAPSLEDVEAGDTVSFYLWSMELGMNNITPEIYPEQPIALFEQMLNCLNLLLGFSLDRVPFADNDSFFYDKFVVKIITNRLNEERRSVVIYELDGALPEDTTLHAYGFRCLSI